MGQPYVSGSLGTNCSVTGPVKTAKIEASMLYGYEEPKGLYAYTKVSAGEQFMSNSATNKSFNTKLYPTFTGGVGYNRTGDGFFANIEQGYKEGVDRTTKVLSEVGKITDATVGIRSLSQEYDIKDYGLNARSEGYSLAGYNRGFNNKKLTLFVTAEPWKNVDFTFGAGIKSRPNFTSGVDPLVEAKLVYQFGK